jgi:hypothetical protein
MAVWPPNGYYVVYQVDQYYDMMNTYRKRFKAIPFQSGSPLEYVTETVKLALFDTIDTDHDGYISLLEFRAWMQVARIGGTDPPLSITEIDTIFSGLDGGDPHMGNYGAYDGKLSFEEFTFMFGADYDW